MATRALTATEVPTITRLRQRGLLLAIVGLLAGAIGAYFDRTQFFQSWLIGFLFCLGITLGCLGLLMVQHLSGGQWGLVGRRVFEAATRTLPLLALLFIPIVFAMPTLFLWARPDAVATDAILQKKAPYLNVAFFMIRAVIYFGFWIGCGWLLTRWSAAQDRGEEAVDAAGMVKFRKLSGPGLLFLVLSITFASTDWVMSLDPHWYSTIFGLLMTVGYGLSALALTIGVLATIGPQGALAGHLTARHFHDLGKLMLAFTMLWAYLSFSQFLIIWSGNLPEEIPWYIERIRGPWGFVSLVLVIGHFALPFLLLLSRDLKRNSGALAGLAIFIIVMRLIEAIWFVAPVFAPHGFPIHWMNIAVPAGLAGVWFFLFAHNLGSHPLMPLNDPYLKQAYHETH